MISKETKNKNVKYVISEIEYIIKTFGKRDPGSEGERKAQEYMKAELDKYSDNSVIEDFKINPGSFFGWIPFTASFALLALAATFFIPLLAVFFLIIGIIPMFTQFVFYKTTFDPLFKEKTSCNVMAVKKPKGEVKRRIIFGGHADATWEWTINYKLGGVGFVVEFLGAIVGAVYFMVVGVIGAIKGAPVPVLSYIGLAFVPFFIGLYFFSNSNRVVDGANDNLSACLVSMAVLKSLADDKVELKNTEVCAFISGSEECGLRGAKAWAAAHKDDYDDVETIFVPLETLRETEHLSIYNKDLNGLVKTDPQVCKLLKIASEKAGYPHVKYATVTVGSTDSAALAQAGLKAATLAAMDHNLRDYYHTRRDTYDNMSEECLEASLDICLAAVEEFDNNGLPEA
jgi:hypothetical protein